MSAFHCGDMGKILVAKYSPLVKCLRPLNFCRKLRRCTAARHFQEPIVVGKCGEVPLNVLRALSSQDVCVVGDEVETPPASSLPPSPAPEAPSMCNAEKARAYRGCVAAASGGDLSTKYAFAPITLLNASTPSDDVCCKRRRLLARALCTREIFRFAPISQPTLAATSSTPPARPRTRPQRCGRCSAIFAQHATSSSDIAIAYDKSATSQR